MILVNINTKKQISKTGVYFYKLDKFWTNLQRFFYAHKTFFDIIFLGLYTFEQFLLIILTILLPDNVTLIITIFTLILISTISFEKICMESRYTDYREQIDENISELKKMTNAYNILKKEYEDLASVLSERTKRK